MKLIRPIFISTFLFIVIVSLLYNCAESPPEPNLISKVPEKVEICDKNKIQDSKLLSVAHAYEYINEPDYLFIEVSKEEEYKKGHIPNAINIWRPDFRSKEDSPVSGMRCNPQELVVFLQELGIHESTSLMVYDAKGGSDALRLAWVLDYYGFKKYKVINGGKKAWTSAGLPLSKKEAIAIRNNEYTFETNENQNILAQHSEVLAATQDTNTIIVDTRELYEYDGQCFVHQGKVLSHKRGAFDRGRIPTSIHLNWSTLSDLKDDHRIKCAKDLKYDLAQRGITKDKNIIVYCQSGSRSSHTAFILSEILDYPNVKNYDGSWIEWSYLAQQGKGTMKKNTDEEDFEKEEQRLKASLEK